jgi:sulfite oxidase
MNTMIETTNSDRLARRTFMQGVAASVAAVGFSRESHARDPVSNKLIYHTKVPANAEPPLPKLVENWLTPNELFYIRSHAPVPKIDPGTFRLKVEGRVEREISLSLNQLNKLASAEAIATLTCAGNRRSEHSRVKQVSGVPWNEGAIGNARWGGVKLSTLLKMAGLQSGARHVWFEGLDQIAKGGDTIPFGGSIPIAKALLDSQDMPGALVALKMNGVPLPPDHGFPVRTVVPGYIGARSVKWLGKIVVSDNPSPNHYVQDAYKLIARADELLLAEAAPLYTFETNSAICIPTQAETVAPGKIKVAGYALAGGAPGNKIVRVELTSDGGRTWMAAKLPSDAKPYCWQLWQTEIPLTKKTRQLTVRALDSTGLRQPQHVPWNAKGYQFNAWHHVPVKIKG